MKMKFEISESKILSKLAANRLYYLVKAGRRASIKDELDLNLNRFVKEEVKRKEKKYIRRLSKDIFYAMYRNLIDIHEYFYYHFDQLNELGREQYVGRRRQTGFWQKFEAYDNLRIFDNFDKKEKTYQLFSPYYKRELLQVNGTEDRSVFSDFVSRHNRFILKPRDGTQGKGIRIVSVTSKDEENQIFNEICAGGGDTLEEVIEQAPQMAAFHPGSVNTIRYVTFYHQTQLHKICAVLRMGRGDSCVDNACAGGIYAPIDLGTGVVCDYGRTHRMEEYLYHPDTGAQILGAHIPKWEELNKIVEEAVKVVPQQKQVGWDFALTEKGWVLVEANHHPGIQFLVHRHGLRQECDAVYRLYKEL